MGFGALTFTDYLAVYAAILSTAVFLWSIAQSRPRFVVDLLPGVDTAKGSARLGVYVMIRNVSSHDVHLAAVDMVNLYTDVSLRDRLAHMVRFKSLPLRVGGRTRVSRIFRSIADVRCD